ncbi:MAG: ribosomal RNA small subunit methyltransferase A [Planctomycetes bacterium]|nr:ribosomal RNA small subunit methyltransferase A [Planctomycetota bacterium]MBU2596122.1 ribosomal RNA small subunit methyltransferase A [Planctomycetota bacterium]
MQTKTEIQRLLAGAGVEPNKRLGQHFLIDLNLMQFLLTNAAITENDIVLEVGTGTGSLTGELVKRAGKVIAVECDDILVEITKQQLEDADNFEIVVADVLESKNTINRQVIEKLQQRQQEFFGRVLLVANLPYNVASSVMLNLLDGPVVADEMVVTVQKEVAQRMAAEPGSEDYGILSIFLTAMGRCKVLRKLSPKVFWPVPQVDSAMVRFDRDQKKADEIHNVQLFKQVVDLFMGHRRKMMRACVKYTEGKLANVHNWEDIFRRAFVEPHHRPEELRAVDYIAIANLCNEIVG